MGLRQMLPTQTNNNFLNTYVLLHSSFSLVVERRNTLAMRLESGQNLRQPIHQLRTKCLVFRRRYRPEARRDHLDQLRLNDIICEEVQFLLRREISATAR